MNNQSNATSEFEVRLLETFQKAVQDASNGSNESNRYAFTDREVARFLDMPLATIQEMLRRKELPGKKVGRYWRIPRRQFEAWLEDEEVSERKSESRSKRGLG